MGLSRDTWEILVQVWLRVCLVEEPWRWKPGLPGPVVGILFSPGQGCCEIT